MLCHFPKRLKITLNQHPLLGLGILNIIEFKNDQNSNKKNAQLMYNENLRPLVSRLITTIQYGENADEEKRIKNGGYQNFRFIR